MKKAFLVMALILIAGAGWTQTQPQTSPTSPEQAMEAHGSGISRKTESN